MKITEVEASALVWLPPEKHFRTALRPIGLVSEWMARVHTGQGIVANG